jgi:hypothetical protein
MPSRFAASLEVSGIGIGRVAFKVVPRDGANGSSYRDPFRYSNLTNALVASSRSDWVCGLS